VIYKYIASTLGTLCIITFFLLFSYTTSKGSTEKQIDKKIWDQYIAKDRIPLWEGKCSYTITNEFDEPVLMTYRDYKNNTKGVIPVKRSFLNDDINPKPNIRVSVKPITYRCEVAPYERKSHLIFRSSMIRQYR